VLILVENAFDKNAAQQGVNSLN